MASHMKISQDLHYLNEKCSEICFYCNSFKKPGISHNLRLNCCIKEDHGWSKFFNKNISKSNFKILYYATSLIFTFVSICLYLVLLHQNKYLYKSSNLLFNLIELHMSITFDARSGGLNIGIIVLEMIWMTIF
jgi:hypothetical protein